MGVRKREVFGKCKFQHIDALNRPLSLPTPPSDTCQTPSSLPPHMYSFLKTLNLSLPVHISLNNEIRVNSDAVIRHSAQ